MGSSLLIDQVVNGLIPNGAFGTIAGYISTSATTTVTVRASAYTAPGNNAQRSIKSASASDAAAGTGARTVKITYYDASLNGPFTETITLNGTTAVNSVSTTMAFIESMVVTTVGSGGGNVGVITLTTGTGGTGTTIGTIMVGDNRTFWAHHYVAAGKTGYVYIYRGSATVVAGAAFMNTLNPIDSTVSQQNPAGTLRHGTSTVEIDFSVPIVVPGPAQIFINEKPDAATASTAFASFDYIEF